MCAAGGIFSAVGTSSGLPTGDGVGILASPRPTDGGIPSGQVGCILEGSLCFCSSFAVLSIQRDLDPIGEILFDFGSTRTNQTKACS